MNCARTETLSPSLHLFSADDKFEFYLLVVVTPHDDLMSQLDINYEQLRAAEVWCSFALFPDSYFQCVYILCGKTVGRSYFLNFLNFFILPKTWTLGFLHHVIMPLFLSTVSLV